MPLHYPTTPNVTYLHTVHNAVTEDVELADAKAVLCAGAKAIAITFTEAGTVNNRQATITVQVSIDGTNFYPYNMLIDNLVNSNAQEITRIASKNISTASTKVLFFDPTTIGAITHFKIPIDVTDGASPVGTFTVQSAISY